MISEEELYTRIRGMSYRALQIPEHMHESIINYIVHRQPVGDFLRAVLANDLKKAISKADEDNLQNLAAFPIFLHMWAPDECHGSAVAYEQWIHGNINVGDTVVVDNVRYHGEGICKYFTIHMKEFGGDHGFETIKDLVECPIYVAVLLGNGNVWHYDLATVKKK